MLEVKGIENGLVLDHITAGNGLKIFNTLFATTDQPVVLLMNVKSDVLGSKDIIKVENVFEVNVEHLGLIDPNVTINTIVNGSLTEKQKVVVPKVIEGGLTCQNPRCITHTDDYAQPTFTLISANGKLEYECSYCEEITLYKL